MRRSGSGTKIYGDTVNSLCYPVGEVKLVTNTEGAEVTSTTQLYVDGTEAISVADAVVFNGREMPILSINDFYRDGAVDIRVVHL